MLDIRIPNKLGKNDMMAVKTVKGAIDIPLSRKQSVYSPLIVFPFNVFKTSRK